MDPIVATYTVKVTVRAAADTVSAMPIDALTETIEGALVEAYGDAEVEEVTVNATAERTDQ